MLYVYTPDQPERYVRLLQEALPDEAIACWPQEVDAAAYGGKPLARDLPPFYQTAGSVPLPAGLLYKQLDL